ncbi:diguanylate cyclase [Novimethylophilus kurashikiensis]|uniref:Diguanylate cyclase n=1 Tax=Novimethylophilus kurashikiensis TaxID=1825523 RepID=A0A2R5F2U8_9PROT|nr:bifunctional diguanylate cyclase/phosphodiesterase [Novimethylophilus kurashikiensis]GBG12896.1 diguanylate cyclase [Novimethylophilus kurashikiensis]
MNARDTTPENPFLSAQRILSAIFLNAEPRLLEAIGNQLAATLQCPQGMVLLFENDPVPPAWKDACERTRSGQTYVSDQSAAVPLLSLSGAMGAVGIAGRAFTETDIDLLESLAACIAPALEARLTLTRRERELDGMTVQLQRQAQILDRIEDSVITMDLMGYITGWNGGAERLFGYSANEAIGQNILFLYVDEDEADPFDDPLLSGDREMVVQRRKKSGEVFWASVTLSLARDQDGNPAGLVGYVRDITERLKKEESLRLFGRIFENSGEGILITDADEKIVAVNQAFTSITGFGSEDVLGETPRILRSGRHDKAFYEEMWTSLKESGHWQGELWDRHKDGAIFPKWANLSAVKNDHGVVTHYISTFSDISERVAAEERIRQLAFYDTLTGLPNRSTLYSLMEQALIIASRQNLSGALMFIDLDRFKYVNDTLGHGAGDQLIQRVATRFKTCLRASDVVARLGGDEFVVALVDIAKPADVAIVAQKILAIFASPFLIDGHEISISASIGISVYPTDGNTVEDLLKHADIAMYRAKEQGRSNFLFYSDDMNVRSLEKLELESSLRRALDRKELLLFYQPQADIHTGEIIGAEVLLRWEHPDLGMVSPIHFIPLAEETGLIVPIGQWVIEQAVAQNKAWEQEGVPVVKLAVNLSAQQFRLPLVDEVSATLKAHGLAHELLELEITESMVMNNVERVIDMLTDLAQLGMQISLDDFGTGYSSLSYLKRFPIDKLKVDQSFVRGIPSDADDISITRAIIAMGKSLGLKVIAEGVETQQQLEFLRKEGCDEIQGYLFSRPLPAEEFVQLLKDGHRLSIR